MIREDIKTILNNFRIADAELGSCADDIEDYIDNLLKMVELGEHYKHLYSEVKKQKDDVVEYIKKNILIGYDKYGFDKNIVAGIVVNDLLRMLGEIDVED